MILEQVKDYMMKSSNIDDWNRRRQVVKNKLEDSKVTTMTFNKIIGYIDGSGLIKKLNFPKYKHDKIY